MYEPAKSSVCLPYKSAALLLLKPLLRLSLVMLSMLLLLVSCYPCRWGNAGFAGYVTQLASHADEALSLTPEHMAAAKEIVEKVAELEVGFWNMAYNEEAK